MSLNIYNPTTQQLTEVAGLDVKDSLEKVATLPTPTADYLNQVYILVGTQEGYHVGSIYQCRYINSAYTWVEITGSVVGKADKAPNATNNHLAKLTADGNLADSGIAVGDLGTAINKDWTDLVRPNSHDLVESNAVYSAITNAISSIYTPHGDITCAELVPALLIDENIGNVYTVTDSGTTTAYFMQGAGKTINTGDSVSIIKAGENTILFNLMGNVLDLTDYQKKNLTTAIEIGGVNKTTVEDALNGLNDHEEEDIEGIWKANGELGVKNLLLNKATTQTVNGVTFTVNTDGTVLVDGTATATIQFELNPSVYVGTGNKITISGCPSVDSEYNIRLRLTEENTPTYVIDDIGESVTYEATADKYGCRIIIFNGYTANNLLFKPMIRLATDPDDTYVPYAMTNRELTVTSYTDNSVYASRTSKGDLVDMSLIGGTLAWNQLVQNGNFETTDGWGVARATMSASNNILTVTPTTTDPYVRQYLSGRLIEGHKCLVIFTTNRSIACLMGQSDRHDFSVGGNLSFITQLDENATFIDFRPIAQTDLTVFTLQNVMAFDLTLMFGTEIADYIYSLEQANAGDGVAWFKQYFPNDYYAYDAGSLLSVNTKGRKITSGSESTTYAIDPIDLRGVPKLVNNKLNYDGDIYKSNGAITRKYGIVDLGTLNWQLHSSYVGGFHAQIPTKKKGFNPVICSAYPWYTQSFGWSIYDSVPDKTVGTASGSNNYIYIKDTSYNDVTAFKAVVSGVYLVYELETETTEIVSPYINPQRVYDGGTEEFLRDSTPIIPVGVKAEYYNNKTSVLANEYTDSVGNSKVDWKVNGVLGAKNLLPYPYFNKTDITSNGITYTINDDGSITANGTATNNSTFHLYGGGYGNLEDNFLKVGTSYKLTSGGAYTIDWQSFSDQAGTLVEQGSTNSNMMLTREAKYIRFFILIGKGVTVSNRIYYPMLRLATDPDNTYQPYAMTNQQITPYVQAISNPNLLDNPWFNVNQRGVTSWSTQFESGIDRWRKSSESTNTIQVTDNGIKELNNGSFAFYQVIDNNNVNFSHVKNMYGHNLTLSVMFSDGTIEKGTLLLPSNNYRPTNTIIHAFISDTTRILYAQIESYPHGTNIAIGIKAGGYVVKAVKLELGNVSTLAIDTAPNYVQELHKCQAYFERNRWFSWTPLECIVAGEVHMGLSYKFNTEKVTTPIFSFANSNMNGYVLDITANVIIPNSEIVVSNAGSYNNNMIDLQFSHASFIVGHKYYVSVGDNVFDIIAEL